MDFRKFIIVKGAKENNLKNIDITIPKNQFIVFSGVSGSGKSSLAFDTIYEEGRRRYIDSLSSYARQFLGNVKKPDVVSIDGLSPSISIEQKTTHNNPRSIVGTVTEIYDYLRLLFARIGKPFCPNHKIEITAQTTQHILKTVSAYPDNSKLIILAPIVSGEKGSHINLLTKLKREGFLRVMVNKEILSLDDSIDLKKNQRHTIDIVVDRVVKKADNFTRIRDGIDLALDHGKGVVKIIVDQKRTDIFSRNHSCPKNDFDMGKIEPRLFSFNSVIGMCKECKGLGIELKANPNIIIPNRNLSINDGAISYFKNFIHTGNLEWQTFKILLNHYQINLDEPINKMDQSEINIIYHGSTEPIDYILRSRSGIKYDRHEYIEGIADLIERRFWETSSESVRTYYRKYMADIKCSLCQNARLNKYALAVKIAGINIYELSKQPIKDVLNFLKNLSLSTEESKVADLILSELFSRLSFLLNVGLGYISLDRKAETLSGGEAQRIRLATQIGSKLSGVLYVLDEPSIGLHQKDNIKLIETLKEMVDIGNTLIVVEHDEETIRAADHIIDIGRFAGEDGGEVIAQGNLEDITNNLNSITGDFLAKRQKIKIPTKRRVGNQRFLFIKGARENNLKNLNVKIPLGMLVVVTGVSGSGKSTLINDILVKGLVQKLTNPNVFPGLHKTIENANNVDRIVSISQSPIGRTPRSNPATYTSVFNDIRDVFAAVPESRERGYSKSRFSFNIDGGRCDRCSGDGYRRIEMHFLPDVYIKCDNCNGTRYKADTLEIKYHNKNIADVLSMSVNEALTFFSNIPKIKDKLQTIQDVGLSYIKLGQSATTLSGGEAQRVKLATFLQKKPTGKTLYVLDEPTTGLHSYDVLALLKVLNRIVNGGDSVVVIEHNLDVIKTADYIIDLGPDGGDGGGKVVAVGSPEVVKKSKTSYTAVYLNKILK